MKNSRKKAYIIGALIMILSFSACNQRQTIAQSHPTRASWWKVNAANKLYVAKKTYKGGGPEDASLLRGFATKNDTENGFLIAFLSPDYPTEGSFFLNYTPNAGNVTVTIVYNNEDYTPSKKSKHKLWVHQDKGNISYVLHKTWFYANLHPKDSILVEGVFILPNP